MCQSFPSGQRFSVLVAPEPEETSISNFFWKGLFLSSLIAALFLELSNALLKQSTLNVRDANALNIVLTSISFVKSACLLQPITFFLNQSA